MPGQIQQDRLMGLLSNRSPTDRLQELALDLKDLPLALPLDHNYYIIMLRFEWDPKKSAANKRKHGVSFEEAQSVFFDESAIEYGDPAHSHDEDRFLLLGKSIQLRVLVVCHCYRSTETTVRLISARKATTRERRVYTKQGRP